MDIQKIKQLRERTGAGMMECKEALEKSNENIEDAVAYLDRHMKKTTQNQRVASKGRTHLIINGDDAILFEVNAETDFAAKHKRFIELIENLAEVFIKSDAKNIHQAYQLEVNGKTVEQEINYVGAIMKERAQLRRFHRIKKQNNQGFGSYIHGQGKLSVLVLLDKKDSDFGLELAMIVASDAPRYISKDNLDLDTLNYEKFLYEKDASGYPSFELYLDDKMLDHKPSIHQTNSLVKDLLIQKNIKIIDFFRFELGQGIEDKLNCRLDIPCDGSKITVIPK